MGSGKLIANSRRINKAIERLMKWSEKPQWVNFLHLTYGDHLDIPIETLDLEEDEIFDHLGKLNAEMLNFAIFEDFFAGWFGENGGHTRLGSLQAPCRSDSLTTS